MVLLSCAQKGNISQVADRMERAIRREKLSDILFRIQVVNPKTQYQRNGMVIHSDKLKLIILPEVKTPIKEKEREQVSPNQNQMR